MCSLTNHDLIDILDQALWFQTPHEDRVPDVFHGPMCNDLYAYDQDDEITGKLLHQAMLEVEQMHRRVAAIGSAV